MDPVLLGSNAVYNAIETIVVVPSLLSRIIATTRAIFNPLYFGFGFLILFIYAWYRMEKIAEAKRLNANSRILLKKSSDARISLLQYTDRTNGKLIGTNSVTDVLKSMSSKGKIPLQMAPLCQPVIRQSDPNVLWESSIVRIQPVPVTEGDKPALFEQIRSSCTMSIKDATQIISHGGVGYWMPKKGVFSKEQTVYISLNFHDPVNFMGLYADSNRLKRLCSVSLKDFLDFKLVDIHQRIMKFQAIENVRFHDAPFFNATCLIACHSTQTGQ
jgi:hypothetical protein